MRSDKDVLALRMYTVFGLGDVPFNNLAVMGGRGSDLGDTHKVNTAVNKCWLSKASIDITFQIIWG